MSLTCNSACPRRCPPPPYPATSAPRTWHTRMRPRVRVRTHSEMRCIRHLVYSNGTSSQSQRPPQVSDSRLTQTTQMGILTLPRRHSKCHTNQPRIDRHKISPPLPRGNLGGKKRPSPSFFLFDRRRPLMSYFFPPPSKSIGKGRRDKTLRQAHKHARRYRRTGRTGTRVHVARTSLPPP